VRRLYRGNTGKPYLRAHAVAGCALLVAGLVLASGGVAYATFSGTSNGNIAFIAICDTANVGQAVYSINPNNTSPAYNCPPGGANPYTQSTQGTNGTDSMPFFSAAGSTLYFASNRPSGSNTNFAIYQLGYPSTVSGSPGSQTDGATQLTFPGAGTNDYAPTVSADGSKLAFIRCGGSPSTCGLYIQSPITTGTPTEVSTDVALEAPNNESGEANRPEFDPANSSEIIYVDTVGHIHLVTLNSSNQAVSEVDLSSESGLPSGDAAQYPDWNPNGNSIIFDSDQVPTGNTNTGSGGFVWKLTLSGTSATESSVWGTHDPDDEIEPIFAPTGTEYAWTQVSAGSSGSNIQLDEGTNVTSPTVLLTDNKTNNSQPAWQPSSTPGSGTPEAPNVLLLPAAGLLVGGAGWLAVTARRRRTAG